MLGEAEDASSDAGGASQGAPTLLPLSKVELLSEVHILEPFDCGKESLNSWLKAHALHSQAAGHARVYVAHRANVVVGYHAVAPASVQRAAFSRKHRHGTPDQIPVMLIARLAVDLKERALKQRLGEGLLKDALQRCVSAAEVIGGKAILVHALDEEVRGFYLKYDFEQSAIDPLLLFITMAEARAHLSR